MVGGGDGSDEVGEVNYVVEDWNASHPVCDRCHRGENIVVVEVI